MRKKGRLSKLFTSRILSFSKRKVKVKNRRNKKYSGLLFLKILLVGIFFLPFFRTIPDRDRQVQAIDTKEVSNTVSILDKDGNLLFRDIRGSVSSPIESGSSYKRAPHVVDFVLKELSSQLSEEKLKEELVVKTGIDLDLQNYVQQVLLEGTFGFEDRVPQKGVLVIRPASGQVLVMVGSTNYYASGGEQNFVLGEREVKITSDKSIEVSLWDLVRVYSVFANSGKFIDFSILSSIQDKDGKDVSLSREDSLHLIEDMYRIMTSGEVASRGVKLFSSSSPVVGEVAVSYSTEILIGVWSEKDQGGKTGALDILQKVIARVGGFGEGGDR